MFTYTKKERQILEKNYEEAMKDENFVKIVNHFHLTKEEAMKKTSKLEESVKELEHCKKCKGLFECKNVLKGHASMPSYDENGLYFTYIPCKYKKQEIKSKHDKLSEEKINDHARMKDIDVTDKKRVKVIKWLDHFYEDFDFSKKMKGLYLHGNFGCGKTFLISALLNELSEKKNVHTEIIYFPEVLRTLKADWDLYDFKMRLYQSVDILCFDDIGAEKVSEWGRDEVLGTILQSRMNQNLPTFFTSNLTLEELETHFQINASSEEKVKARRIMERIKQLSQDMVMVSENRRD
jgi:primosomal protein DnaI